MNKNIEINGANVYHTYPGDGQKHPGLIVIEEVWGVNDQIRGVADRFMKEGYSVLAPELLPAGLLAQLTPELHEEMFDPEKRNDAQVKLRAAMQPMQQPEYAEETIKTLRACVDYLMADEGVEGSIAVLGFCFGGSYSFHLAANDSRIKAAVPFYGQAPSAEEIPNINCPVMAFYGDQDENLMKQLPELKENMAKNNKDFDAVVYEDAGHAFFNETNHRMYRENYAQDAWDRTLAFLSTNLNK